MNLFASSKAWTLPIVLIFNLSAQAQYQKLLRGQPSPFDTGVVVRIDRYRVEGMKLKMADKLVDSLTSEIKGLHREIIFGDSASRLITLQNTILTKQVVRKDSTIDVVRKDFNDLYKTTSKKWYEKPEGIGIAAIIILELTRILIGK